MGCCRYDAFTKAFDHVSGVIDRIFKELTRSHVHPLGGQAYLSLESADEPFLHGIKYIAMPPSKRYREMELLSGGEKVRISSLFLPLCPFFFRICFSECVCHTKYIAMPPSKRYREM